MANYKQSHIIRKPPALKPHLCVPLFHAPSAAANSCDHWHSDSLQLYDSGQLTHFKDNSKDTQISECQSTTMTNNLIRNVQEFNNGSGFHTNKVITMPLTLSLNVIVNFYTNYHTKPLINSKIKTRFISSYKKDVRVFLKRIFQQNNHQKVMIAARLQLIL